MLTETRERAAAVAGAIVALAALVLTLLAALVGKGDSDQ
jgi:hypothetical protein